MKRILKRLGLVAGLVVVAVASAPPPVVAYDLRDFGVPQWGPDGNYMCWNVYCARGGRGICCEVFIIQH